MNLNDTRVFFKLLWDANRQNIMPLLIIVIILVTAYLLASIIPV